jgi:nitrite reductase/ring-hydroxylating ferredoxin subunit
VGSSGETSGGAGTAVAASAGVAKASRTTVAVYRRSVGASLERVWENVRDWEHLPWLHRTSFASIECLDEGEWGWRARVGSRPEATGQRFTIELLIESEAGRYVTRSLDGEAAGTEIWTRLNPTGTNRTEIEVEFQVPNVKPESADALGAVYRNLYSVLWDEDEEMMVERQKALDAGATRDPGISDAVVLGTRDSVLARTPFCVEVRGREFRVVALDGEIVVHATTCPHRLGPLVDVEIVDGVLECPWHWYRFDVRSGRCTDGRRLHLPQAPRIRGEEVLELYFDE